MTVYIGIELPVKSLMLLNSVTGLTGIRHLKTPLLDLQHYTTGLKRTTSVTNVS